MTKIAYNAQFGGFNLSHEGILRYAEIKGITLYEEREPGSLGFVMYWLVPPEERQHILREEDWKEATHEQRIASNKAWGELMFSTSDFKRDDLALIQVIEDLGERANGFCASLAIRDIPTGTRYRIDEYDGREAVVTIDEYEWQVA